MCLGDPHLNPRNFHFSGIRQNDVNASHQSQPLTSRRLGTFSSGALRSVCIRRTFQVDSSVEVYHHQARRIVVTIVLEQFRRSVTVSFSDNKQKPAGIHHLIHLSM